LGLSKNLGGTSKGSGIKHGNQYFQKARVIILCPILNKVSENIKDRVEIIDELQSLLYSTNVVVKGRLAPLQNMLNRVLPFAIYENQIKNITVFIIQKFKQRLKVFCLSTRETRSL
jgi:hypothetical protein